MPTAREPRAAFDAVTKSESLAARSHPGDVGEDLNRFVMSSALELIEGQVFAGQFRVVKALAQGGMGAVYVVEQLSTGKKRALKLMLPSAAVVDGARRFEQEARTSSLIPSEHVVDVIAAGIEGPERIPWLAMELLEGESLEAHLERIGPLSPGQAHEILAQLAHALSAAHDLGVVHRDLKPDNIFLARSRISNSEFMVKVLDFGLATVVEATTRNTTALGSPLWMAPEQTQTDESISLGTDVWAIGLIVFRMLSGRHYWRTLDGPLVALMREVLIEPLPAASQRSREVGGAELPAGFDEWFERCVVRIAAHRFQHAREAWQELHVLLVNAGAMPRASYSATERKPSLPPVTDPAQRTPHRGGETALTSSKTLLSPSDGDVQQQASAGAYSLPPPRSPPRAKARAALWLLGALGLLGVYLFSRRGPTPVTAPVADRTAAPAQRRAATAEAVSPVVTPEQVASAAPSESDGPRPAPSALPGSKPARKIIHAKRAPSAKPPQVETKPEKPNSTLPDLL